MTSHAVARLAQVSPSTVLAWIDQGLLPAHRTPGGHRRVADVALVEFLRKRGMPVPSQLAPSRHLIVIDDEAPFLRTVRRSFAEMAPSVHVTLAQGGIEGLLRVGSLRPDAVLLDAYMPGMDGVEVCRRIRSYSETEHTAVIALTGRPSAELTELFMAAGATACLAKPLDLAELLSVLSWEFAPTAEAV